jgi:hypothetical protein
LREQNFGLVTFDLAPKMGYSAFAQTAGVLRGSTFVKAFSFGRQSLANAYLYRVSANDGWLILWTSEYVPAGVMRASTDMNYQHEAFTRASVSVSGGGAQPIIAECREWDGQPCDKTSNSIVISTMPVFLRVHGPLQGIQVSGG